MENIRGKLLKDLKIQDIRRELEKRNIDKQGTKQTIINRLKDVLIEEEKNPETYIFTDLEDVQAEEYRESIIVKQIDYDKERKEDDAEQQAGGEQTRRKETEMMNMFETLMKKLMQEQSTEISTKIDHKIEKQNEHIDKHIEDMKSRFETLTREINLQEGKINMINKKIEDEISTFDRKLDVVEDRCSQAMDTKCEALDREIKKNRVEIQEIWNDVNKLDKNMETGIQTSLKIAEEENKKAIRTIQRDIEGKIEGLENKIKNSNIVTQLPTFRIDNIIKFEGDIRRIHPKVFLRTLRSKTKYTEDLEDMKEIIRCNLGGQAQLWFNSKESIINNYVQFEEEFLKQYWSEINQEILREKLYFGRYNYKGEQSMSYYALNLYSQSQFLEPCIREEEIVMYISRHYKPEISETIATQNIKSFDQLDRYLKRVERNLDNRMNRQYRNYSYDTRNADNPNYNDNNYKKNINNNTNNRNFNRPRYNNNFNGNPNNVNNRVTNYPNQYNYDRRNQNNYNNNPRNYNNNTNYRQRRSSDTEMNTERQNDNRRVNYQRRERSLEHSDHSEVNQEYRENSSAQAPDNSSHRQDFH